MTRCLRGASLDLPVSHACIIIPPLLASPLLPCTSTTSCILLTPLLRMNDLKRKCAKSGLSLISALSVLSLALLYGGIGLTRPFIYPNLPSLIKSFTYLDRPMQTHSPFPWLQDNDLGVLLAVPCPLTKKMLSPKYPIVPWLDTYFTSLSALVLTSLILFNNSCDFSIPTPISIGMLLSASYATSKVPERNLTLHLGGNHLTLLGFTDSNWANCLDTRRSIGSYAFSLDSSIISWNAKKQKKKKNSFPPLHAKPNMLTGFEAA